MVVPQRPLADGRRSVVAQLVFVLTMQTYHQRWMMGVQYKTDGAH